MRHSKPWGDLLAYILPSALTVACPYCGSPRGCRCQSQTAVYIDGVHFARIKAANGAVFNSSGIPRDNSVSASHMEQLDFPKRTLS